jgi:hypothetical protein
MKSTIGMTAVMLLSLLAGRMPFFTLGAHGAVNLSIASDEARYGISPLAEGGRLLTISLGATRTAGALTLSMPGGQIPRLGKYSVRTPEHRVSNDPQFEALFVAGTPEHPVGAFRAESGSVTITRAEAGRISGEFELNAHGFVAEHPEDEDQWVTVRGQFDARGDDAVVALGSGSAAVE